MADRVDAAMDTVQVAGPLPTRDPRLTQADPLQLPRSDNARLPLGERGNPNHSAFLALSERNSLKFGHALEGARRHVTADART